MKSNSQTKFLSENYSALHGLNAVPVGLALFLVSLWANVVQYPIRNSAYLMPRIELRLPLYDQKRRLRIVFSHIDAARIHVVDEEGKRLADVTLH